MSSVVRNFVVTFLVSLLIFAGVAYAIVANVSDLFSPDDASTGETSEDVVTNEYGETVDSNYIEVNTPVGSDSSDSFTMLLVGTDYQPDVFTDYDVSAMNENKTGFPIRGRKIQADSIVILKADRRSNNFVFISIPSDMAVMVEGTKVMLRYVYDDYGIEYLKNILHAMTGMNIDYHAVVSVTNLATIIDNTGGIAYNVPTDMRYTDESQNLVINIPKGNALLDGNTAVNMLRYCGYTDGDVSRRALASGFLRALIKKLATPENFTSALTLFSELAQYVETNFTMTDLTKHLEIIFAYPEMGSIELTYPGVFKMNDGVKYYDPDLEAAISLFMKYR